MTWLEIPFTGGTREDIEEKLMPNGVLAEVRNLRLEKTGRLVKRFRYNALSYTSQHTGSNAAVPANTTLSLAEYERDRLILGGAPARLYNYAEDRQRVVPYDPDVDGRTWDMPTFAAARRTIVQSDTDQPTNLPIDSATNNDYTVVATINRDGDLVAYVYSEADGGTFLFAQILEAAAQEPAHVQAVAVGDYILVSWVALTGSPQYTLRFNFMSAVDITGIAEFQASPTDVAVLYVAHGIPSTQARDGDAASNSVLFVYQHTSDGLTLSRWASPFSSETDSQTFSATQTATIHANVYSHNTDDSCWVVWVEETVSTDSLVASYGDAGFTAFSAPVVLSTTGTMNSPPAIARDSSTRVTVAWNIVSSTDSQPAVNHAYVTSTPAAPTVRSYYGWKLISNLLPSPYGGSEVYGLCYPARNIYSAATAIRPSYYMLAFDVGRYQSPVTQYDNIVHARIAEGEAQASTQTLLHIHASDATSGEYIVSAPTWPFTLGLTATLWRMQSSGYERGHAARFHRALYYSGAALWQWDGAEPYTTGFLEPPQITSVTQNTSGNLTQSATYSWIAVYEREESDGSVLLSAPSLPFEVTLSSTNDGATVNVRPYKFQPGFGRIRLYRTLANGSTFHYVTTFTQGRGWLDANLAGISDLNSDATIAANHRLYTQVGNVLANDPPPGARFVFRAGSRLWCAGLEEFTRARCSKEVFAGEAASFPLTEEFTISTPSEILGGGSLDSTPVLFTSRGVWAVLGAGPDDTGAGSFDIREIPVSSGLVAWGHRTIVECVHGLVYQSPEGIMLLPRGFAPPEYIGAAVQDTLEAYPYITSAVPVPDVQELRFTAVDDLENPTEGVMLIWDLESRIWIVSDIDSANNPYVAGALWGGTHVIGQTSIVSSILREANVVNTSTHFESRITTGDIRLGNVSRYGRIRELQLTLEYRADCTIEMEMSVDGGVTWPYSQSYTLSGHTAGDAIDLKWHLPLQKTTRARFRFTDTRVSSGSAGVVYLGMALDIRPKARGARLPAARRG